MSDKDKIYELLQKNKLTSKEVSEQLNIDEGIIRTNISRLVKENRIRKLDEKSDRYCLYTSITSESKIESTSETEFKEGFKELVRFFDNVMSAVKIHGNTEIKTCLKDHLSRINFQLIDKLKSEVVKVE
jgi:predicted transcriptional regulator